MPSGRRSLRFCLDANISYKVAQALATVELPFTHVALEPSLGTGRVRGQQPASDKDIAEFCAKTEHVLVTIDSDFRGSWERSGVLARAGVEVIVFTTDLVRLEEQHRVVTACLPGWRRELEAITPYGYRRWNQDPRRRSPVLSVGKRKRRTRSPRSPVGTNRIRTW